MLKLKKCLTLENVMIGALILLYGGAAMAYSGGMPWEGPICQVARSLSGPTATAIAIIAIVCSGLMMAFGELGGIFKSLLGLLMGICMAVLATRWLPVITGGTSSALGC